MSIIWCGGEDIDFPINIGISSSAEVSRAEMARSAMSLTSAGDVIGKEFTPVSSLWFSLQYRYSIADYWRTETARPFGLGKSGTYAWIGIGVGSTINKIAIKKYDGSTLTQLAEETGTSFQIVGFYKIDIQIQNYGASGTVNVYVDGALVVTYTGDIAVLGQTTLDRIHCRGAASYAPYGYMSECIIADEDTRLMSLKTLVPDAAGDASDWTNSYTSIDDAAVDYADTIFTETVDEDFQCNLTGMPTGDFICKGVKISARATDGVGGIGIQVGVKTNSTVDLGSTIELGGSWELIEELYQLNPVTTNRFTPAEIDALQFAVTSVTIP